MSPRGIDWAHQHAAHQAMSKHKAYIDAINKTGFVLENKISRILSNNHWTVISNKYYEDDHSSTVREVDLIAYKSNTVQHFSVYTTLIISCKKSLENDWALLSRDINQKDPNVDWFPLHAWTNDPSLSYWLNRKQYSENYHHEAQKFGVMSSLSMPTADVFAFQELSKPAPPKQNSLKSGDQTDSVTCSPKNDTAIFNSITSLMKAQAYEINALPNRKKLKSLYQFNLIAIAETDLIKIHFNDNEVQCSDIESEHFIGRYIINRKETSSRVRFVKSTSFADLIQDYNKLHQFNCHWHELKCNEFYEDIMGSNDKLSYLLPKFKEKISHQLRLNAKVFAKSDLDFSEAAFVYDDVWEILYIEIPSSEEEVDRINICDRIMILMKHELAATFRYHGRFEFRQDIPF